MTRLRQQFVARRTSVFVLSLIAQGALVSSALAIDYVSVNAGNYALTTNWNPVGLPGTADNVLILHAMTTTGGNSAHDVVIDSGGSLTTSAAFNVSGDLTVTGTGAANFSGGALTFNGSGLQTVDGAMTFSNIAISNTAPTPSDTDCVIFSDAVALPGGLSLSDGQAIFADGTSLRSATVNANGIFKHAAGATITVTGAAGLTVFNAATVGSYIHNGGTLVIAGPDAQQVNISDEIFNLTVANTDPSLGAGNGVSFIGSDTFTGLLRVQDGEAYMSFSQCADVQIDADGLLSGSNLSVSGDFQQTGTFSPSTTTTTFNGSGPQTISGTATFFGLLIANTAAAPSDVDCVSTTGPITGLGALTVADGQFSPADGSAFRDVGIGVDGILKPAASAEISVTGNSGAVAWSQSGAFDHNGGTIAFTGSARQVISPTVAMSFNNIRVANTSPTPNTSNDVALGNTFSTSTGTITVEDGMFTARNQHNNIEIEADGLLNLAGNVSFTGNFSKNAAASFTANGQGVSFNGSGAQTITGGTGFGALTIANTAATPGDGAAVVASGPVTATGQLLVSDGQFMPDEGSAFRNVSIGAAGILKPVTATEFAVTGANGTIAWSQSGTFDSNGGTVAFTGSARQIIGPTVAMSFNNIRVANTFPTPDASNDVAIGNSLATSTGTITVEDGMFTARNQHNNVQIEADGLLNLSGSVSLSGNFSKDAAATFTTNGQGVQFNGSGAQTIAGGMGFAALTIANTAATPGDSAAVVASGPVTATGQLLVSDGQFMPDEGSAFRDVSIGGAGILKPVAATEFAVTGANGTIAWSQTGAFDSNGGAVAFTGSARQIINPAVAASFHDIRVANTSATPSASSDVLIANTLATSSGTITVEDGMLSAGGQHSNLVVEANGLLNLVGPLTLSGDFSKDPAAPFTPNGQGVSFNGSGLQTITGGTGFAGLQIVNTAATPSDSAAVVANGPVTATGQLTVTDGQFMPDEGSAFRDVSILSDGLLKPIAGTEFSVTGANGVTSWVQSGSFVANSGTVAFTGSTRQTINPSVAVTFHDIRIANTAASPAFGSDVLIANSFATSTGTVTVEDGMFSARNQHNDLVVEADGLLNLFSTISVAGDFSKDPAASFTPNGGIVSFNGSGPQSITGPVTFGTLQINNTTPTPNDSNAVSATHPVTTTGPLQVSDGLFLSPDGSVYSSVSIAAAGELRPENPGDSFTLIGGTGAIWVDSGLFTHNDGTVVIDTPGTVSMSGSTTFHDLTVIDTIGGANSLTGAVGMTIEGLFDIQDGAVSQWADVHDVQIGAGGSWVNGPTAVTVRGDIDNAGALDLSLGGVSFDAGGPASIQSSSAAQLGAVVVATGTLLSETGAADNFTAASLTIDGTLRRERVVAVPGVLTGGLTGASLEFTNVGTVPTLFIDRFGSVPNAAPEHTEAASWEFNVNGGTGFTAHLTLPHTLVVPSQATVSRYLGTGTNWDFVQDAFTPTTVTRNGITDLTSRWAVGDSLSADVEDWTAM